MRTSAQQGQNGGFHWISHTVSGRPFTAIFIAGRGKLGAVCRFSIMSCPLNVSGSNLTPITVKSFPFLRARGREMNLQQCIVQPRRLHCCLSHEYNYQDCLDFLDWSLNDSGEKCNFLFSNKRKGHAISDLWSFLLSNAMFGFELLTSTFMSRTEHVFL